MLLAACTITSRAPLIDPGEGAAPLPDAFTFEPYEAGPDGYTPSTSGVASFVRHGDEYVTTNLPDVNGELAVRFVPIAENTYIVSASVGETPDVVYGFARYTDGVLAIALTPDKQTVAAIARERWHAMPKARHDLGGVSVARSTSEVTVGTRAALDYLAGMYAADRLPMGRLSVGLVTEDPDTPAPSRLVPSGHDWIRVP